jgi:hypothetical protein
MPLVSGAGHYVGDPVPVAALDAVVVHPAPCGRSGSRLGEAIELAPKTRLIGRDR